MGGRVLFLPGADRHCRDCGGIKAIHRCATRLQEVLSFLPAESCGRCGDEIEAGSALPGDETPTGFVPACQDCGTIYELVRAEVNLPEPKGCGWTYLCGKCVARYDDGEAVWMR